MKRESIQWDASVSQAIDTLWYVTDIDKNGGIDQAEYTVLHRSIHKALETPLRDDSGTEIGHETDIHKTHVKWTRGMCEVKQK